MLRVDHKTVRKRHQIQNVCIVCIKQRTNTNKQPPLCHGTINIVDSTYIPHNYFEKSPTSFIHRSIPFCNKICHRVHNLRMSSLSEEVRTHVPNLLFVQCGFGNDSHGQSATKAACKLINYE